MADLEVLRQIRAGWAEALERFDTVVQAGPFLLTFNAMSDLVWINYAVPVADASVGEMIAAMPAVREEFSARGRVLRFEFFEALAPELAPLLEREGLGLQAKLPALVCTRAELGEAQPHEVEIRPLAADDGDEILAAHLQLVRAGFEEVNLAPAGDAEIRELRERLASGTTVSVMGLIGGHPAGAASLIGGESGAVAELVGVATTPALRGRGVARALSRYLVEFHLDRGGAAVWLSAGNDTARRVYERIGFRFLGWQMNYVATEWLAAQPATSR